VSPDRRQTFAGLRSVEDGAQRRPQSVSAPKARLDLLEANPGKSAATNRDGREDPGMLVIGVWIARPKCGYLFHCFMAGAWRGSV
jgi:hypothetical protein